MGKSYAPDVVSIGISLPAEIDWVVQRKELHEE